MKRILTNFKCMKRTVHLSLFLLITTIFLSCDGAPEKQKQTNEFKISGEIKKFSGTLFFRHPDKEYSKETKPDSITVKDGLFEYSDTISKLSLIRAYTDFNDTDNKLFKKAKGGGYYPVKSMYLMFFAFPGADVKIQGKISDFMDAYPSGDEYNNSLGAINKIAYPNFNKSVNLMVQSSFEEDSLKIKELQKEAEEISELGNQQRIAFIKHNPNTLGAVWYLDDMVMRSQVSDSAAFALFKEIPENIHNNDIYQGLKTLMEAIAATSEGATVPEINTTATLDGSAFNLESYRGKYVLIDFWGIWCGPCVAEMPRVKEFQEKHKDKLIVLGINSGDTKEKIRKFVDEKGYDWKQLMSDKANTSDNFVNRFNVKGFPTKFIIDPKGKIVKRYVGSGEEAFDLLEEMLGQ
ncbi:TlpA family protein disulfide reductase [Zhouia spongiae]|uniref:TlpA family protein disulfide reductase n=1 Tax=Zhouia spongiae TaxID=2202721 RepID=A0ABY3YLT7_9FLAO|nr:TlpA disulfide reductase family protein [Zhouia spongiae]UNY98567.1 TlpA family protein disulfide reductase [Zhouia spongiae]